MKLFKNKFVIGLLCILAGVLISFAALPALQSNMQGNYASVVRMMETIQAGTQITADMVDTVSIPENLVQDRIGNITDAIGKYANTELYAGDYLTNAKASATLIGQNVLSAGTEKGKMVISVTVPSLAAGISGRLQPGDVVSVIAVPKASSNQTLGVEPGAMDQSHSSTVIYPELQYLEVCMVTASDGADANVSAEPDTDQKNSLPATISFYVNKEQALKLAELEQNSIVELAFVARGQAAAQFIPDGERVFNKEVK